ncbi:unnamed protein product [Musa hybrid cultivar]
MQASLCLQRRKLATQLGMHESFYRDMMVMFRKSPTIYTLLEREREMLALRFDY